ncbi:hypothetical protein P3L10_012604 [Capsicum annuum]
MFSKNKEESTNKGEIGVSGFDHRHQEEIGVSTQRDQLKSVLSSSTMLEGTSKYTLDMDEIKTYINTYVDKQIAELKTLISNIPVEGEKIVDQQQGPEEGYKNMTVHIRMIGRMNTRTRDQSLK